MRISARFLAPGLTLVIAAAAVAAGSSSTPAIPPDLIWHAPTGETLWSLAPAAPRSADDWRPQALPLWFPELPPLEIELFGGGRVELPSERDEVVVLTFWATWCAPCQAELRYLQRLYEATAGEPIRFVAINVLESPQLVLPWVEDLGLTLPIGRYEPEMGKALVSDRLPTTLIADRDGKVRRRWEAFEPDAPDSPERLLRALLAESEPPMRDGPRVGLRSVELLPRWLLETAGAVNGLLDFEGGFLVSGPAQLDRYRDDGMRVSRTVLPRDIGLLRDGGSDAALAFRPGGRSVFRVRPGQVRPDSWALENAVFDLAAVDPGADGGPRTALVGSLDGLYRLELASGEAARVGGYREVSGVIPIEGSSAGGPVCWALLEAGRRVVRLDRQLAVGDAWTVPSSSWSLVAGAGHGFGVASDRIVGAAVGRFAADRGVQVAIADGDGRLRIVDLVDGEPRYDARWPGIAGLLAVDPDGDGIDALLVARGEELALLSAHGGPPAR